MEFKCKQKLLKTTSHRLAVADRIFNVQYVQPMTIYNNMHKMIIYGL